MSLAVVGKTHVGPAVRQAMRVPARQGALLVVAACLLVLAGCSGGPVDGGGTSPAGTATPAPVPTDDLSPGQIAPGVSPGGIEDPGALETAHEAVLRNRSYRWSTRTVYRYENGTVLFRSTFERRVDPANDTYAFTKVRHGVGPRRDATDESWANATSVFERRVVDGEVTFDRHDRPDRRETVHGGGIVSLLAEVDPDVIGKRQANGTTEYVLVSRNVTRTIGAGAVDAAPAEPGRLVAVVTREGLVRSVRLTRVVERDGAEVTMYANTTVTGIDDTTVERPDWVATAANETREESTAVQPGTVVETDR